MVMIGKKGQVIKSSSAESAFEYFQYAGLVDHGKPSMNNANGRSLIWEVASPEGLGKEMARTNCRNNVLFYDELSTLTSKASVDNSSLTSRLLALYESGKFQNIVKNPKDGFSFDPGTYCVSLIACCTDKNFLPHWGKLAGSSSGLDDRFFFLFQPKTLVPITPQNYVSTQLAAAETRKRIDAAIKQETFEIYNDTPLRGMLSIYSNRQEIRAEKFALGFAIDLGLTEIDEECIERGLALVEYEKRVKDWLNVYEAVTLEGTIQAELRNLLVRNSGVLPVREVLRGLNANRYGTTKWMQAYKGLIMAGQIREEGTGTKGDPKIVVLLEAPEEDD
jgi:hypothetical protein